jgi:hypothetical protein
MARRQTEVFAIMTPERARALEALARAVKSAPYFHDGGARNCLICRAIVRLSRASRKKGDHDGK